MKLKMKRIFSILLSLLLVLGLMPGMSLTAWASGATSVTIDMTAQGWGNAEEVSSASDSSNTVTAGFSAEGGTHPAYYNSGNALRLYAKNTMTISAAVPITSIDFTFGSGDNNNEISANCGSFNGSTWTGSAESVTFTIGGTIKHRRIQSLAITLEPAHTHDFSYSASGDTITATCANTDGKCTLDDGTEQHNHAVTLTLSATDATYNGSAYTGASLSDTTAWTDAGLTAPTIEYSSTSYTKSSTAPTDAGTYSASITVDTDKTATADFTISPMALTIDSATATNRTYDKDSTAVTISAVTFKNGSTGVTLTKDTDYTVTGAMTDANAGNGKTVNVTVTLLNGNYSLATNTTTTTVNISKAAAQTIADVTDSQIYTVNSVSKSVAGNMPDDAGTLTYSAGTASKTGSVTVSNFNVNATSGAVTATLSGGAAGDTVTLPVTISSTNYADSTVNVVITLTDKNTQTITASDVTATYGDTDKSVSATTDGDGEISYAVKEGSEDYIDVDTSTGALTIKKAGTAVVIVTAAETDTYAQATKEVTVTINKANAVAATVTANNRAYDGTEKDLVTVDASTLVGGEMRYAIGDPNGPTTEYTTTIPAATEVGSYYVWYKVFADDEHLDTNPVFVKVKILNTGMFADIEYGTWKYTAAEAVYEKNIMVGKGMVDGKIIFAPDDKVKRSQFVTSIYAMAGKPDVEYVQQFSDVKESDWFAKAVTWAANNEIAAGTGAGQFGVNGNATREQVAVMLYKFAQYCGYDVSISESTTLDGFTDADKVHSWALDAVKWAVERGIISGKGSSPDLRIAPEQGATRIECAAMLNKFSEVCKEAVIPENLEEPLALPTEDIEETPASIDDMEEEIVDDDEEVIDEEDSEVNEDQETEDIEDEDAADGENPEVAED